MRTLTEKYNAILEGNFSKSQFVRDARLSHPNFINQFTSYEDAVKILKNKGLVHEAAKDEVHLDVSPTTLDKAIRYELEKAGVDYIMAAPDTDDYLKAKAKAEKALAKDRLYYLELNTSKKKRSDLMQPVTKANTVDKVNGTSKVNLREAEDFFASGLDLQLAFKLHKAISNRLRQTGNTFEQEWPLASNFGFFANEVASGKLGEQAKVGKGAENPKVQIKEAIKKIIKNLLAEN